jgi:hypothetical protein
MCEGCYLSTMSNAELRKRLAEINEWLSSGAKTIVLDGMTISIDQDALRKERSRIEAQLPEYRKRQKGPYGVTGLGG